jgi:adenosylcobinamide-phosphate synthase
MAMALALALDAAFGEPPSACHPVVWIGSVASALERYAPSGASARLAYGGLLTAFVVGGAALAAAALSRVVSKLPTPLAVLLGAWLCKTTFSMRALLEAGGAVESALARADLSGARNAVKALVSRDVGELTQQQLTSAVIESLAENTTDSIVAPLVYYAIGGLPLAFAYRASNTLDAMIGYRGEYEHLGKVAARLDDLLNVVPARLTSALLLIAGAIGGGDVGTGTLITRRDHGLTASPNAGWPMSTIAGLLGTRLEKPGHYTLGANLPPPDLAAIDHAAELVKMTTVLALVLTFAVRLLAGRRRASTHQVSGLHR